MWRKIVKIYHFICLSQSPFCICQFRKKMALNKECIKSQQSKSKKKMFLDLNSSRTLKVNQAVFGYFRIAFVHFWTKEVTGDWRLPIESYMNLIEHLIKANFLFRILSHLKKALCLKDVGCYFKNDKASFQTQRFSLQVILSKH